MRAVAEISLGGKLSATIFSDREWPADTETGQLCRAGHDVKAVWQRFDSPVHNLDCPRRWIRANGNIVAKLSRTDKRWHSVGVRRIDTIIQSQPRTTRETSAGDGD